MGAATGRLLSKPIRRSSLIFLCDFDNSIDGHMMASPLSSVKMRELLIDGSNNKPIEILPNKFGKNDYITNILQQTSQKISLEVSPNSDFQTDILNEIGPRFVAVTWLGNTHLELPTHEIPAIVLARKFCDGNYPVLLHLAGRNIEKHRMLEILNYVKDIGVKNIFALQGDWVHVLEKDDKKCDFPYASDLVSFIKENFGDAFCVCVAGYPNVHPHCQDVAEDIQFLKQKVANGADLIITQAAFEYEALEKFAITCREHNVRVPILPGILVIKSYKGLLGIAKCCEFKVPQTVLDFLQKNHENDQIIENYGLDLAADLARKCLSNKELFAGVHIFSMNNMVDVQNVLSRL